VSEELYKVYQGLQYLGDNGAAVAAELGMQVVSDDGQTLVLRGTMTMSVPKNFWVVWADVGRTGAKVFEEMVGPINKPLRFKPIV